MSEEIECIDTTVNIITPVIETTEIRRYTIPVEDLNSDLKKFEMRKYDVINDIETLLKLIETETSIYNIPRVYIFSPIVINYIIDNLSKYFGYMTHDIYVAHTYICIILNRHDISYEQMLKVIEHANLFILYHNLTNNIDIISDVKYKHEDIYESHKLIFENGLKKYAERYIEQINIPYDVLEKHLYTFSLHDDTNYSLELREKNLKQLRINYPEKYRIDNIAFDINGRLPWWKQI